MFLHLKVESGFRAGKFCEPPLVSQHFKTRGGMDTLMSMAGLWIFYLWNRATQIELFTDLHQPWARAGWSWRVAQIKNTSLLHFETVYLPPPQSLNLESGFTKNILPILWLHFKRFPLSKIPMFFAPELFFFFRTSQHVFFLFFSFFSNVSDPCFT